MPMSHLSDQQRKMVEDLRAMICLAPADAPPILREIELATRYNMSRTPVRQVLQYLGHCALVETQRGYGTVVRRLELDERDTELRTYSAVATACAMSLDGTRIPKPTVVDMSSIVTWLEMVEDRTDEEFVALYARLIATMGSLVQDGLLRHAYSAAFWRVVRWRVVDLREDRDLHWTKLHGALQQAKDIAITQDAAKLLEFAAMAGRSHLSAQRNAA